MADQDILVTLDNLEYYQEELIKKLPKEQVWYGNIEPSSDLPDAYILAVNYQAGKIYYRLINKKWKIITSGNQEEGSGISSKIAMQRVSQENIYISPDDNKCEISCKWSCTISGKQVSTNGTISVIVNTVEKQTFKAAPGTIKVDVREYLKEGSNRISIKVVDGYGTEKSLNFVVEVVKLTISTSGYKQNQHIDINAAENGVGIYVITSGNVSKKLHMKIDEEEVDLSAFPAISSGNETVIVYIPKQENPGSYLVEIYTSHTFSTTGKTIYSNSVFLDTIWIDKNKYQAIIASQFRQTEGKQYDTIRIPYYLYNGASSCLTRFTTIYEVLNSETGQLEKETSYTQVQERQTQTELEWIVDTKHAGQNIYRIDIGRMVQKEDENGEIKEEFSVEDWKEFTINLEQQDVPNISEVNGQLHFSMVAPYTDNKNEADRTNWPVYHRNGEVIIPLFKNFDWQTNGWMLRDDRPALKISNGAELHVPYKIFGQSGSMGSFTSVGGTIEIDVSFDEISDSSLDFFSCYEESTGTGVKISPSRAILSSGGSNAEVKYSSSASKNFNNSMRFTFVINPIQPRYKPQLDEQGNKIEHDKMGSMYIYINGVGASANVYSPGDVFRHLEDIVFKSDGCSVFLHSLKVHQIALSPRDIMNNWIFDMNAGDQINAYNQNQIYDGDSLVNRDVILEKQLLPCLTFIGRPDKHPEEGTRFPTFKGDKKTVDVIFEGTEDGLYDFSIKGVQMDVQGTSSQYYPVKNWKFKAKDDPFVTSMGEMEKYALADDQLPAKVFCLKADYMETSSTHNTVTANLANSMYNSEEKTPPQRDIILQEGEDEAKAKDRANKTRTTIYGRPILVFYKEDEDATPVFGGKYNFNYDKDAEDVFGFFESKEFELVDCVEFRANDNRMCNFLDPFSVKEREDLKPAEIKEYDDYSITGPSSAQEWGNAFEFRYHWHREEGTEHYSYLQAVSDWIYNKDCNNPTNKKLDTPVEERTFETGIAKFLYDNDSKIVTFKDTEGNTRKALNLGGATQTDYLIQSYFETKKYDVTKSEDGTETLRETEVTVVEKEAYSAEHGKDAWNELIQTEGQEEHQKEENNFKDYIRIIRTTYHSLQWDPHRNNGKGSEVYIFENDTKNYRLTLFKNELPEHFNVHYCLMYFLLMELLAMIDSGTKNMFWATWGERHEKHPVLDINEKERDYNVIWYPIFYDMDSILGLNNVGKMNIPYSADFESNFEDFIGTSETGVCFNGAHNVFWNNFRQSFQTELNLLFNEKVANGTFSLSKLLQMYESHSENFPAAIYNEDGKLKITDKYFQGYYEATPEELEQMAARGEEPKPVYPDWLYVYQGDRYYYRRFWLPNRFNYMLSKNFAGSYAKDFISMRLYDPNKSITDPSKRVHTDYDFTIETWKDQYTTIKYGSRSVSVKCQAEQPIKIEAPNNSYNDTETAIFGASNIKRIGDVSTKYATTIDLSAASGLIELDLGNSDKNYSNAALTRANFGSNTMLRRINLENCIGLSSGINLSACPNIKEINAKGTSITSISLGKNGILETLLLPSTIKSLVLTNQPNMKKYEIIDVEEKDETGAIKTVKKEVGFLFPEQVDKDTGEKIGYNLTSLVVKNTPNVNTRQLVEDLAYKDTFKVLSLEGVDWTGNNRFENGDILLKIKQRGENGTITGEDNDSPRVYGDCEIYSIKDYLLDELNSYFNDDTAVDQLPEFSKRNFRLKVLTEPTVTHTAKFYNYDGTQLVSGIHNDRVEHDTDFSSEVTIRPTRPSEWDRDYKFVGWSVTIDKSDENYDEEIDGAYQTTAKIDPDNPNAIIGLPKALKNLRFDAIFDTVYKEFTFEFYCDTEQFKTLEGYNHDKKCLPVKLTTEQVELGLSEKVWAPIPLDYNTNGNTGKNYAMYRHKFEKWACQEGSELDIYPYDSSEPTTKTGKIKFPETWSDPKKPIQYGAEFSGHQMYRIKFYDTSNDTKTLLHARENLEDNGDAGGNGDIYYLDEEVTVPMPPAPIWNNDYNDYKLIGWKEVTEGISKGTNFNYSENNGIFTPDFEPKKANAQTDGLFEANKYEIVFETVYEDTPIDYTIIFNFINGGKEDTTKYEKTITKTRNWEQSLSEFTEDEINKLNIVGYNLDASINKKWKKTSNGSASYYPKDWMTHMMSWSSNKPGDREINYYVVYSPIQYEITFQYEKSREGVESNKGSTGYFYKTYNYLDMPTAPSNQNVPDSFLTKSHSATLTGWTPSFVRVEGKKTYTAEYNRTTRLYEVVFKNWDEKLIQTINVEYNKSPEEEYRKFLKTDPERPDDEGVGENTKYSYEFAGWLRDGKGTKRLSLKEIVVDGPATYVADYDRTTKKYNITWKNNQDPDLKDNDYVIGESKVTFDTVPDYGTTGLDTPKKPVSKDNHWSYDFMGWEKDSDGLVFPEPTDSSNPSTGELKQMEVVKGPQRYGAVFQPRWTFYNIKFVDWDGKVLKDWTSYEWGTQLTANEIPQGPYAEGHRTGYTFVGWTGKISGKLYEIGTDLPQVKYEETYQATYTPNYYSLTFRNQWNTQQSELLTEDFEYDTKFVYSDIEQPFEAQVPTQARTWEWEYEFSGWTLKGENGEEDVFYNKNEEISIPPRDAEFYANFIPVARTYKINFYDIDVENSSEYGRQKWNTSNIGYKLAKSIDYAPVELRDENGIALPIPSPYTTQYTESKGYELKGWRTQNQTNDNYNLPIIDSSWANLEEKDFYIVYEPVVYSIIFRYLKVPNKVASKTIVDYSKREYVKFEEFESNYGYKFEESKLSQDAKQIFESIEERLGFDKWYFGSVGASTTGIQMVTSNQSYYAKYYTIEAQLYTAVWYGGPNLYTTATNNIYYGEEYSSVNGKSPPWYSPWSMPNDNNGKTILVSSIESMSSGQTVKGDMRFKATVYNLDYDDYTFAETSDTKKGSGHGVTPLSSGDDYLTAKILQNSLISKESDYCLLGLDIKEDGKLKNKIYRVEVDYNASLDMNVSQGYGFLCVPGSIFDIDTDIQKKQKISQNGTDGYLQIKANEFTLTANREDFRDTSKIYFGYYEGSTLKEVTATFTDISFRIHYRGAKVDYPANF